MKDEIVQCDCGWCGTRSDAGHHRRTDPRHVGPQRIAELEAENQRLKAELGSMKTATEIMCSRKPGAAANVVREDYPEIAAIIDGAFERELQAANLAHEQYREWAAGQMEQMKAKLAEAESILSDNEHLDARIEHYFEAKRLSFQSGSRSTVDLAARAAREV